MRNSGARLSFRVSEEDRIQAGQQSELSLGLESEGQVASKYGLSFPGVAGEKAVL